MCSLQGGRTAPLAAGRLSAGGGAAAAPRALPRALGRAASRRAAPLPPRAAAELADPSETVLEDFEGRRTDRGDRGYTPFEYIEFTRVPVKHEVTAVVGRGVAECYRAWADRLNWMAWFDEIDEVGFHEEEPTFVSMYLWYRWAHTPFLELYVTLERTRAEEGKFILEEPVEGAPLTAAVLFTEVEAPEGAPPETAVTLRLSYLLPKVLHEFAGRVAVYADVDAKLEASMARMREFVEAADLDAVAEGREADWALIRGGFAEQRALRSAAAAAEGAAEAAAGAAAARGAAGGAAPASEGGAAGGSEADEPRVGAGAAAEAAAGAAPKKRRARKPKAEPADG